MPPNGQTYEQLVHAIRVARVSSRQRIEQVVRQEKVREAWETGKLIDEHILLHKKRADYGKQVLARLANDLESSQAKDNLITEALLVVTGRDRRALRG